ncbi:hypothetical protein [Acinetobacter junii]|uniref:hypothetical protein n=1 Tax=Acinetobacter junii TaxID=40215 RepID=UPI00100E1CDC|nr:hypothetical protein [Acinetobacter junii]RXS93554.1 hypothetical protein ETZ13_12470 [Acinetobacter junii]
MNKLYLVTFIIAISTISKASDDWYPIATTDESKFFINVQNISESREYGKTIVKSWIKMQIFNDITKDGLSVGDYSLMLYHSNCEDNTVGMKSLTSYKNGKLFGNGVNKSYVQMNDAIPESIGESIIAYSCEGIKAKKAKQNEY